jgi:HlyD family secretion protein
MTEAQIGMRGPILLGAAALVALIGGFGLWATQATLAGAILAPGLVEVDEARQVVQHPDGGVVAEILVRDGALVAAGSPLPPDRRRPAVGLCGPDRPAAC